MKLAIYAHFNAIDSVIPFAWSFLESLRELGFQILFVSNSPICESDAQRLRKLVRNLIIRENQGLDFFMWKVALADCELSQVSELLLTNSSIIGPVNPMQPVFEQAAGWDCDFWGMTDSFEIDYHIQSYFLVFRQKVIASNEFRQFWDSLLPFESKIQMIRSYEVGLTLWLQQHGFRGRAVASSQAVWQRFLEIHGSQPLRERLKSRWREPQSASRKVVGLLRGDIFLSQCTPVFYPDILLEMGVPFVKASLLAADFDTPSIDRAISMLVDRGHVKSSDVPRWNSSPSQLVSL